MEDLNQNLQPTEPPTLPEIGIARGSYQDIVDRLGKIYGWAEVLAIAGSDFWLITKLLYLTITTGENNANSNIIELMWSHQDVRVVLAILLSIGGFNLIDLVSSEIRTDE